MVRKITRSAICLTAGLFALTLGMGAIGAEDKKDDKVPTIEEIMKQGHAGTKSLKAKIELSAKAEKWEDAQKSAVLLKAFGEALGKNKPEKGEADSWKKLSVKYSKTTADIASATDKKDAKAVSTALGALGKSCKECHDIHK